MERSPQGDGVKDVFQDHPERRFRCLLAAAVAQYDSNFDHRQREWLTHPSRRCDLVGIELRHVGRDVAASDRHILGAWKEWVMDVVTPEKFLLDVLGGMASSPIEVDDLVTITRCAGLPPELSEYARDYVDLLPPLSTRRIVEVEDSLHWRFYRKFVEGSWRAFYKRAKARREWARLEQLGWRTASSCGYAAFVDSTRARLDARKGGRIDPGAEILSGYGQYFDALRSQLGMLKD